MRRIPRHIHQLPGWPRFHWNDEQLATLLAAVRHKQGYLLGRMESLGFSLQKDAELGTLTLDVLKSSEIEGEKLNAEQVRSSIARRLGMDIAESAPADRRVEGAVEMMLDATQNFDKSLTRERLFAWHAALFPTGRSGMRKIKVGAWRNDREMSRFIDWANKPDCTDLVLRAAVAHLWFVTIHPFDDGNGRIARAIGDGFLAKSENNPQRFYSMSAQIRLERKSYYDMLEETQKGTLDITHWIEWFLECLGRAIEGTQTTLAAVLRKARFWERHAGTTMNGRQRLILNKLLDGFDGKLTTLKWARLAKCSHDTALRDIQRLIDMGILFKEPAGGRSTSYSLRGPEI